MLRPHASPVVIIVFMVSVYGCGGGGSSPTAPSSTATSTSTTQTTSTTTPTQVTITSLSLTAAKTTLQVGETTTVTLTAFYSDGTSASKPITCTPSNGSVVSSTASCTVTALAAGTSTYTHYYEGYSDSVTFTVVPSVTVTSISVSAGKTMLQIGKTTTLAYTVFYSDGTSASLPCTYWNRSYTSRSSNCRVTALALGSETYPLTYAGYYDSITITVVLPTPASFSGTALLLFADNDAYTFLGCLNCSQYSSYSVHNQYGSYGSRYAITSIWNRYSSYGGRYSSLSPCNPYTSTPPRIYDGNENYYGRLTNYGYHSERTQNAYSLSVLASVCAFTN